MATYVPADCFAYAEINNLPRLFEVLAGNNVWKAVVPELASINARQRFEAFAARTGIGPAEVVLLGRAQIAIAVFSFDTSDTEQTLNIRPRVAIVIETHSWPSRGRSTIEKIVGDFATRAYKHPQIKRYESENAQWTEWTAPQDKRRILVAGVDSLVIVGNDEAAVLACLAVRRGERPSLASKQELAAAKARVLRPDSLAFGYVSSTGSTALIELVARAYAGNITDQPAAQSAAASLLPEIANRLSGELSWSANGASGKIEDDYSFEFSRKVDPAIDRSFLASNASPERALGFLPGDASALTIYSFEDPAAAWQGFRAIIASRLDATSAFFVSKLLDVVLEPYGVSDNTQFFRSVGPEITTARLGTSEESTVAVAEVRNEESIRSALIKGLGANPHVERQGTATLLISRSPEQRAAAFADGYVILGNVGAVRRCLQAHIEHRSVADNGLLARLRLGGGDAPSNALSINNETESIAELVQQSEKAQSRMADAKDLTAAVETGYYSESRSKMAANGFERRTVSNLGLFGTLLKEFSISEKP